MFPFSQIFYISDIDLTSGGERAGKTISARFFSLLFEVWKMTKIEMTGLLILLSAFRVSAVESHGNTQHHTAHGVLHFPWEDGTYS